MGAVTKHSESDREAGRSTVAAEDSRIASRLAWSLWAAIIAVGAASLLLRYLNGSALTSSLEGEEYLAEILWWDVLVPAAIPAYATVGAIVASRRPRNAVGWLCLALGALVATQEAGWEYAARSFEVAPEPLPASLPVAWVTFVLSQALLLPFILVLLLFPDGRLTSRRWWPVLWVAVTIHAAGVLSRAISPVIHAGLKTEIPNPTGLGGLEGILGTVDLVTMLVGLVVLVASVVSIVFRWRESGGIERLQLKWLAYAGSIVAAAAIGATASGFVSGLSSPTLLLVGVGIVGATVGTPLAISVAVLRYRLYEIDLIVNRTLVYGALTACVVGIYVLVVGYLGAAFRTSGNLAISLLATGVVAVLFAPLRERLQRGVNRLMYGERDEPYAVLSRLGQRLEATLDPKSVLPTIVETVAGALKSPHAEVSLYRDGDFETAARHGTPVGDPLVLPLVYGNETVGRLAVSPRAKGESFTTTDQRLLEDLARQAGVAAHAVRLTEDLQRSRARLVSAREEERRRLRRDLHDGVGPRLAALTLKIETARNRLAGDPTARELLSDLAERAREAVADVRRSVHALRPPVLDDLGLVPALRETAAQYNHNGLNVSVEASEDLPPMSAAVEVAAYRIVQEALTNTVRHAGARRCAVRFAFDEKAGLLRLEVEDDGRREASRPRAGSWTTTRMRASSSSRCSRGGWRSGHRGRSHTVGTDALAGRDPDGPQHAGGESRKEAAPASACLPCGRGQRNWVARASSGRAGQAARACWRSCRVFGSRAHELYPGPHRRRSSPVPRRDARASGFGGGGRTTTRCSPRCARARWATS